MDQGGLKTLIFLLSFETAFSLRMISGMLCISSSPADASSLMPSRPGYDTVSEGRGSFLMKTNYDAGTEMRGIRYVNITKLMGKLNFCYDGDSASSREA